MAVRSSATNRYQNYGCYSTSSLQNQREDSPRRNLVAGNSVPAVHEISGYQQQQLEESPNYPSTSSRLEYIVNAMAYIRGELDDLKESDRVLLDIFKQLKNNVSELNDNLSTWKVGGGRPASFTDLDLGTSRSSYCEDSPRGFNSGLETILDTSKEDVYKASTESDSLYLPEHDSSSNSCSPVLPSLKSHPSVPSVHSTGGSSTKISADPSPQLRTSTSFTGRLANSPSITRLQDDTSSNISRNSSIDSGIQFASEAENGSANGVEPMQVPVAETEVETTDVQKSVGFADDIFSVLGM